MHRPHGLYHAYSFRGVGHMATNDDGEYDGYYISKGTIVFGNAWSARMIITFQCPDFFIYMIGPYCMTRELLTTQWSIDPSDI